MNQVCSAVRKKDYLFCEILPVCSFIYVLFVAISSNFMISLAKTAKLI